jgi:hypothetical protein
MNPCVFKSDFFPRDKFRRIKVGDSVLRSLRTFSKNLASRKFLCNQRSILLKRHPTRLPAGLLGDSGLKRHYKLPEPVKILRLGLAHKDFKCAIGEKRKHSGSSGEFDARARRTAPEGRRDPHRLLKIRRRVFKIKSLIRPAPSCAWCVAWIHDKVLILFFLITKDLRHV